MRPLLFKVFPLLPSIGWGAITLSYVVRLSCKVGLYVLPNVQSFSLQVPLSLLCVGLSLSFLVVGLIVCGFYRIWVIRTRLYLLYVYNLAVSVTGEKASLSAPSNLLTRCILSRICVCTWIDINTSCYQNICEVKMNPLQTQLRENSIVWLSLILASLFWGSKKLETKWNCGHE